MANEHYKPGMDIAEGNAFDIQKKRSIYEAGARSDLPAFYRYVVLETIFDPTIIDQNKIAYFEHSLQVSNIHLANVLPRNTIIAKRVMTSNTAASTPAMFLFPFFPPALSLPCQPGEHVWVIFENQAGTKNDLGFWMCRIVEPGFVEDANHTHAPRGLDPKFSPGIKEQFDENTVPKYEFRNGRADERDGDRYTIAETAVLSGEEDVYEKLITKTDGGRLSVLEPVPRYRKRPGDISLEGSNNTLISLGRDRIGPVANYVFDEVTKAKIVSSTPETDAIGTGTGAIDLVVGRGQTNFTLGNEVSSTSIKGSPLGVKEIGKSTNELVENEGDPDFITDRSRVYIAQRTRVDVNLGINNFNLELSNGTIQGGDIEKKTVQDTDTGDGAIVIKSDKIRLIARSDIEILVTGHTVRDEKGNLVSSTNEDEFAVVAIKANGDIVFRPAKKGYIKLGGDDANLGLVCSDLPVTAVDGIISGPPLTTTMGGFFFFFKPQGEGNTTALTSGQAKFSNRILVK